MNYTHHLNSEHHRGLPGCHAARRWLVALRAVIAGLVLALLAASAGIGPAAVAEDPDPSPRPTLSEDSIGQWRIVQDSVGHWNWVWGSEAPASPDNASLPFDASFVTDVTVPDGTVYAPGERFEKTWQVRNTGSSTWDAGVGLDFVSGDRMEGAEYRIAEPVAPGDTHDATVAMVAPMHPGDYRGSWRMADTLGEPFGEGLTVVIQVADTAPLADATAELPPKQFVPQGIRWSPNCGMAMVKGYVYDLEGNPVNGLRQRLWSDEWEGAISLVSGVGLTYGPGEWDISLLRGQTGRFYLAVWDWQTGPNSYARVESEVMELHFDYTVENCEPGGDGHQVAEVNFIRNF